MPTTRKRRSKRSTPARKPSKSTRKRRGTSRWVALTVVLLVIGALGSAITFVVIDRRTTAVLTKRNPSKLPMLYSDGRTIEEGNKVSSAILKGELGRRQYRETSAPPTVPGEFSVSEPNFTIYTREYQNSFTSEAAQLVKYNTATGEVSIKGSALQSFTLEPQPLSDLVGGDVRSLSFTSLQSIPAPIINAVISTEDERFYSHFGIDLIGIARAMVKNVVAMRWVQGGSTLTQQLAKNLVLSPKRTLGRKFLEMFSALSIERQLSKDQILELYLNEIYLGQEGPVAIHGVTEAAQNFFGKKLNELTIGESALIAGIIKAPSYYSPRRHPERARERRNIVLDKMLETGAISKAQHSLAMMERVKVTQESRYRRIAPHYTVALRRILDNDFDLDVTIANGLNVYTGLDIDMQRCAERALSDGIAALERRTPSLRRKGRQLEGGLVALEPFSGKIRAWAGGRDYSINQFDHVYSAKRQVGSTIKPFVYLTALDPALNSYKPATAVSVLADEPTTIMLANRQQWTPENFDHQFRGDVTLRYALENSLNLPAVYLAQKVGMAAIAQTVRAFRVSDKIQPVPALALGAAESSLLDLTAAYSAIANGGIYVQPRIFLSAVNRSGETLISSQILEQRVADENAVFVLTNLMQGVLDRGTGARTRSLGFTAPAAGKTGTSNEARDAWFVGFTPDLAAGVWVGFDDNSKLGLTGSAAAVPIWTEFMKCAAPLHDALPFVAPPGVEVVTIDKETRKRVTEDCPADETYREVFIKGTAPSTACQIADTLERKDDGIEESPPPPPRRRERSFWEIIF